MGIEILTIDIYDNVLRRKWVLHPLSVEDGYDGWDEEWVEGMGNNLCFGNHQISWLFDAD